MELSFLKLWIKTLIKEAINKDQLVSVAKRLNVADTELETWINMVDPTPGKSYSVWILRGLKYKDFRFEDIQRVRQAIHEHIRLRNANLIPDIMQFPKIDDLEQAMAPYATAGAKRQGYSGVNPETLPGVTVIERRPDVTFFRVTNPESLAKMGEGTKWCTRLSYGNDVSMAKRYIQGQGSIIVGYKDGKPFVQYNPDFSQVMDTADRCFHGRDAKSLNLPMPNVKIDPNKRWRIKQGAGPETVLQRWQDYVDKPVDITQFLPKGALHREPRFEKLLARSIARSNSFLYMLQLNNALMEYSQMFNGQRSPEIEDAILNKDWTEAWRYRGSSQGKHSRIPIIKGIAEYVKHAIRGHWPEFEKKYLNNDPYNAAIYFTETGLRPDSIDNPTTKQMMNLALDIKNNDPKITTPEFQTQIKQVYDEAVKEFSHSKFAVMYHHILIPYIQKTHKNMTEILGPRDAGIVYKNVSVLDQVTDIPQNRDPRLEKLLLTKVSNSFKDDERQFYYNRDTYRFVQDYAKNIIKGPWKEFENLILQKTFDLRYGANQLSTTTYVHSAQLLAYLAEYSVKVRKDDWPELRNKLSQEHRRVFDQAISRERIRN